jgi:hypothetical protein
MNKVTFHEKDRYADYPYEEPEEEPAPDPLTPTEWAVVLFLVLLLCFPIVCGFIFVYRLFH